MKEGLQVGKFITFFVIVLFLNYFLGVFFSEIINNISSVYSKFIGRRGTPLAIDIVLFFLYMGYILVYVLLSGFVLNFFLGINKRVLHIHMASILLSLVVFIALFFQPSISHLFISKFILALPFISILVIVAYGIINGMGMLIAYNGAEKESSGQFFGVDNLKVKNYDSSYVETEKQGFFASLFADIKNSINKGMEEDRQRLNLDNVETHNGNIPFQTQNNQFFTEEENSILNNIDLDTMLEESKYAGESLISEDKEAAAIEKFENMSEKDFNKEWKKVIKDIQTGEGEEEKDFDVDDLDFSDYTPIGGTQKSQGVINLGSFIREDDNLGENYSGSGYESSSDNMNGTTENIPLTAEDIKSGGLSSLIKASNNSVKPDKQEDEEKERGILDNLENSFFLGFTDDKAGVSQLERLYKEL